MVWWNAWGYIIFVVVEVCFVLQYVVDFGESSIGSWIESQFLGALMEYLVDLMLLCCPFDVLYCLIWIFLWSFFVQLTCLMEKVEYWSPLHYKSVLDSLQSCVYDVGCTRVRCIYAHDYNIFWVDCSFDKNEVTLSFLISFSLKSILCY